MGVRVRVERRTNRLFLDIYNRGRRRKVYTHLPDTPKNREILQVKAETIEREIFLGTFDAARHFPREATQPPVTFRQLYEEWRRKKMNEVSSLTLKWYEETVNGRVLPYWGARRLDKFTPASFDEFKALLLGDKISPRTVNVVLMRLREMLRLAYERDYIKEDRARWVVLVRGGRPEIHPLSFEEKEEFLKALPLRWRPYFVVAFGTGLRPSEQVALRWEWLDQERKKILVREGWRRGQRTLLKTEASNREVDFLPAVRRAIEEQRLVAGGSALVFPNRLGGYIHVGNLRHRVWYPALEKAGLKGRDLYNTRHTFATHALASGEDPGWVQKMLGHTTLTMLMTRYYRYVPNLTRRDGTLLGRQLERRRRR